MDLYTLGSTFLAQRVVDQFVSAIWTERYSATGDVQLVVPATIDNINTLKEGTFLAKRGTEEVMLLDTQSIENGLLTVKGPSLLGFLNERMAWFTNDDATTLEDRVLDYTDTEVPGQFIADVVEKMVISPVPATGTIAVVNLDWANEVISGLSLGDVDTTGTAERLSAATGPLYDAIAALAAKYNVGISLYLESADPVTGYSLKFTTYQGLDRTSTQITNPLVRLLPALDSLTDVKELRSINGYKNVAYVLYNGELSTHYADPLAPAPEEFERRSLVVKADGQPTTAHPYDSYVTPTEEAAFRDQQAKDALANANYVRAVDGQTSPENEYVFGRDYGLGDIIELESYTGLISKARITEHISTHDQQGEREYPTLSVVAS